MHGVSPPDRKEMGEQRELLEAGGEYSQFSLSRSSPIREPERSEGELGYQAPSF